MIALLTNVFPVILGFLGKLIAIKSQASSDALQLAILGNQENTLALDKAREQSNNESPMAALTRRTIIYVILGLVVFSLAAPVIFDIPTVIPTVREGIEFFGLLGAILGVPAAAVIQVLIKRGIVRYRRSTFYS